MGESSQVTLGHGAGGSLTRDLIESLFIPHLKNNQLLEMGDSAVLDDCFQSNRLAFTTDSYVVTPLFFPGGDIGKLAVNGTINDLVVTGAMPRFMSAGFILEESLPLEALNRIVASMSESCHTGGVRIVAADTKVVDKGKGDGLFINTSGFGAILPEANLNPRRVVHGDRLIVTGTLGDHGISIFLARQELGISADVMSDCAPLTDLLLPIVQKFGDEIHFMRDLTRGGFASIANEMASHSNIEVCVREEEIPVSPGVSVVCEMLGFDPLYLANEGKAIIAASAHVAEEVLKFLQSHKLGRDAAIVGTVNESEHHDGRVYVQTSVGGTRLLDYLIEDQLPRIC